MREPAFWWREAGLAAGLLAPLAAVYGAVASARLRQSGARAAVPVICIGNLTVGGAGKTPLTLTLARLLQAAGDAPFLLSRGYGGRLAGPLQVDPVRHRAADVGDEPLLLARVAPAFVARDRVKGAQAAVAAGAGVIVMDDGFQNPSLQKSFSVLVVDARRGIGNGRVVPAGPLRAPLAAQLARADALVVVGTSNAGASVAAAAHGRGVQVFQAGLVPDAAVAAASILARDRFVGWLDKASETLGTTLPKGAGPQVITTARALVAAHGPDILREYAKVSFKTTRAVLENTP